MPLFLFIFIFYNIHKVPSSNHIHTIHSPRPLSISSSLVAQWERPPCGAEPGIELGPGFQQADALPTEPRRTINWATPHHLGQPGVQKNEEWDSHGRLELGMHCNENPIYVFLFWEMRTRSLNPNFHIHVSLPDLYIPRIGPHTVFNCSKIDKPILEIYKSLTDMSVETGRQYFIIFFWK